MSNGWLSDTLNSSLWTPSKSEHLRDHYVHPINSGRIWVLTELNYHNAQNWLVCFGAATHQQVQIGAKHFSIKSSRWLQECSSFYFMIALLPRDTVSIVNPKLRVWFYRRKPQSYLNARGNRKFKNKPFSPTTSSLCAASGCIVSVWPTKW